MKKVVELKLIKYLKENRNPLNIAGRVFTFGKTLTEDSLRSHNNYGEIEQILKQLDIPHDAENVRQAKKIICKTYGRDLVAQKPPKKIITPTINIADYYTGKIRNATNGQAKFKCTITIKKDVWQQVVKLGANIGIKQIQGILLQDPILISQKSKQTGVRCIKPESYGWIFSTSCSQRLVDKDTHATTTNPTKLIFSKIEKGH